MEHDKLNNPCNEGRIVLLLLRGKRNDVDVKDVFLRIRDKKLDVLGNEDNESVLADKIVAHKIVTSSSWVNLLKTLGKHFQGDLLNPVRMLAEDCRQLLECHCNEEQNKDLCPEFSDLVKGKESDTTVVAVEWSRPLEAELKKNRTLRNTK